MMDAASLWGARWRTAHGVEHWLWIVPTQPALFTTRRAALEWIAGTYGYIRERPDLRSAPHFWRMPKPARVRVILVPKTKKKP